MLLLLSLMCAEPKKVLAAEKCTLVCTQGHPTDRFGILSVRKALNPYNFLKGIFSSNFPGMKNLRPSVLD